MGGEYLKGSNMGKKKTVRISERHFQLINNRADYWEARGQKKKWNRGTLTERYIELGAPYFLEAKEFDKHVSEGFTSGSVDGDRQTREKGDCENLRFIRENWRCVKGSSSGGTVKIRLLGPEKRDAYEACVACVQDRELEEHREKKIRAKDKLKVKEHTYCKDGGWYDDNTGRIHCKRMDTWQNQDVCFTIAHGKPCPSLKTLPSRGVKRTGIQRRKR